MDVSQEMHKIITVTIEFAHTAQGEAALTALLHLTKNLLFVLDEDKSTEYKFALIEEYLEGIAEIINKQDVTELLVDLHTLKTAAQQKTACDAVVFAINQFFDPDDGGSAISVILVAKHLQHGNVERNGCCDVVFEQGAASQGSSAR